MRIYLILALLCSRMRGLSFFIESYLCKTQFNYSTVQHALISQLIPSQMKSIVLVLVIVDADLLKLEKNLLPLIDNLSIMVPWCIL